MYTFVSLLNALRHPVFTSGSISRARNIEINPIMKALKVQERAGFQFIIHNNRNIL